MIYRIAGLFTVLALIGAFLVMWAWDPTFVSSVESANAITPVPTPSQPPKKIELITIAAVGDIMMGSPFPNDTRMPPTDGADLLKAVTPVLSAADIARKNARLSARFLMPMYRP